MPTPTETPNSSNNPEEKIEIKFLGFVIIIHNPKSKRFIILLTIVVLLFLIIVLLFFPAIFLRGLIK